MKYEIIDSVWVSTMRGCIGVVAIKSLENQWKAYICQVNGLPQEVDEQVAAEWGAKLSKRIACAYFPNLDPDEYGI